MKNLWWLVFILFALTSCQSKMKREVVANQELDIYKEQSFFVQPPFIKTKIKITELAKQNKQTMILVHGLGSNASSDWYKLIPQLTQKYHLVLLDLPGFGQSEYNHQAFYTPEYYAKLLGWVSDKFAKPRPIIIAHSLGAAVAIKYAAENSSKVSKLVLMNVAGILQESVFARYISNFKNEDSKNPFKNIAYSIINKINLLSDRLIRSSDSWININKIIKNKSSRDSYFKNNPSVNAAAGLVSENFSDEIRLITLPTLIIWGEKDPVAPIRTGEILNKHITNSHFILIKSSGHSPMLDNPNVVIDEIFYWLDNPIMARTIDTATPNTGKAACDNKASKTYTGYYREITIEDCDKVQLKKLLVERLVIKDSIADLNDVSITQSLIAKNSKLTMTNVFTGKEVTFSSHANQLDIAGSDFNGLDAAIDFTGLNTVYWSVSSYRDKSDTKIFLHGRVEYQKPTEL